MNQSHTEIWTVNASGSLETKISTVVTAAPTMVTNMTGFLIITAGFSFLKESTNAGATMAGSKSEWAFVLIDMEFSFVFEYLEGFSGQHEEVLHDRAEGQRGEEVQRAHQQHGADEEEGEGSAGDRE